MKKKAIWTEDIERKIQVDEVTDKGAQASSKRAIPAPFQAQ